MGRTLGSHGPICRHLQLHPLPSSPVSIYLHRKLADTTFLSCLVYTRGLKVADTRAFILGVRRVLLGLPQHLGEGQLHVLVYCFQQEVPEQQGENAEHSEASKGHCHSSEAVIFTLREPAEAQTNTRLKICSSKKDATATSHFPFASSLPGCAASALPHEAASGLWVQPFQTHDFTLIQCSSIQPSLSRHLKLFYPPTFPKPKVLTLY